MVAVSVTFLLLWENPMSKQLVKEEFILVYVCRRIESMMAGAAGTPGGSASWELTPWTASTNRGSELKVVLGFKSPKPASSGKIPPVKPDCLNIPQTASPTGDKVLKIRSLCRAVSFKPQWLGQISLQRARIDFHVELWGQLPVLSTHYTERCKYLTG